MKVAVFSDLHLKGRNTTAEICFAEQLAQLHATGLHELWLLGDIFDLFVGSFSFWREEHPQVFANLVALVNSGCKVRWCEGNHDFHMQIFLHKLGIEVFDDDMELVLGGRRIYLAHGDLVNPDDADYLRWRAITRSLSLRWVLDWAPEILAKHVLKPLAHRMSRSSRTKARDSEPEIRERYRQFARKRFAEGYDAVFLGHCHVEDLYVESEKFYCNLGSALDGQIRFATWNPEMGGVPKVTVANQAG